MKLVRHAAVSRCIFVTDSSVTGEEDVVKPTVHIAASTVISALLFGITKSVGITMVSFFTGFLIDIDHVFDYVREYGFQVSREKFFRVFYENRFRKLLLVFHGWEWIGILFLLARYCDRSGWALGMAIGALQHLVLDQIGNTVTGPGYFFVYRIWKRFAAGAVVRDAGGKNSRPAPKQFYRFTECPIHS